MARKPMGKRLRFEIFKRDEFTCRYCGRKPPEVMLVIDHIVPVAAGGTDDPMNLQTACEECNQGKADIPLGKVAPRPDADPKEQELRDLELEQEIAELRRYQERQAAREAMRLRIVQGFQDDFDDILQRGWVPTERLLLQMLDKYPAVVVGQAVTITARALSQKRVAGYTAGDGTAWVRYLWGVARNLLADEEEAYTHDEEED